MSQELLKKLADAYENLEIDKANAKKAAAYDEAFERDVAVKQAEIERERYDRQIEKEAKDRLGINPK